jgi:hypothetical protein
MTDRKRLRAPRIKKESRGEYMQPVNPDHLPARAAALLLGAFVASIAATFRDRLRDYVAKPRAARSR